MSPKQPHLMSLCLVPRRNEPQRRSAKEHPIISLSSFMFVLRSVKGRARPQHVWKKKKTLKPLAAQHSPTKLYQWKQSVHNYAQPPHGCVEKNKTQQYTQ